MPSPLHPYMPILAASTQPSDPASAVVACIFAAIASIAVAWLFGFLRPAKLGLAERIPSDRPLMPFLGVLFAGLVVWLVVPTLFLRPAPPTAGQPAATAPGTQPPALPPREVVIANATIPLIAFAVLIVGDSLVRPRVGQRLGLEIRKLPAGVVAGIVGILFTLPVVYCTMVIAELIYQRISYQHPSEHDLLRVMGETPEPFVKNLAIVAAVVVAPLWEELLFRGHVQTLIRAALVRLRQDGAAGMTDDRARAFEAFVAAVLAAMLFAGVHAGWQQPPIFVLAVCLGVAYERTGNLWVPIVMHASFNTLMTTTYFLLRGMMN